MRCKFQFGMGAVKIFSHVRCIVDDVEFARIEFRYAVEWCRQRGVEFYAINKDFPEEEEGKNRSFSRKLKADVWIDDRNIGGLPDWGTIYQMITERKSYAQIMNERLSFEVHKPKKKWWQF